MIKNLFKKQKPIAETNQVNEMDRELELQRQAKEEEEKQFKAVRREYETLVSETIIKIKDFQIGNGYVSFTNTILPSFFYGYDSIDGYEKAINELKSLKNDFADVVHRAYDIKHFTYFQSDKEYSFYPIQSVEKLYFNSIDKLYLNEEDWNILIGKSKQ